MMESSPSETPFSGIYKSSEENCTVNELKTSISPK